jgi:CRP/FNR family transcriptional regulator
MTQSELAAHLGTTREVIAKLLRKMVADKSVKTLRGSIVVERPELLARLAGRE